MPDWNALVREQLAGLSLERHERREVIAELAAHLEETFEDLRQQGLQEEAAVSRTLSLVNDWQDLRRRIQTVRREENIMTDRVRQWWLPGFVALFLSVMLLAVNQFYGPKPLIMSAHGSSMGVPLAVIYVPWLLLLIPIGAMGAYLARRAGGSQGAMLLSILFPVLPQLAFFIVVFPVALILDGYLAHNVTFSGLLMGFAAWIVLPGVALLAGGLPTQFLVSRRSPLRSA
jgi:hypothetical protein